MVRGMIWLAVGAAAFGATRFCRTAIAEERKRRDRRHHDRATSRWETEGGMPLLPAPAGATHTAG